MIGVATNCTLPLIYPLEESILSSEALYLMSGLVFQGGILKKLLTSRIPHAPQIYEL